MCLREEKREPVNQRNNTEKPHTCVRTEMEMFTVLVRVVADTHVEPHLGQIAVFSSNQIHN